MKNIIGYGEDSLTYWAFNHELREILNQLNDGSEQEKCVLFYRPSFGRGGRGTSNFGEFDSILATEKAIYLIECKWDKSSEWKKNDGEIRLGDSQIQRHEIFKWYFEKWNGEEKEKIFVNEDNEIKQTFSSKFKKVTKTGEVDMTIPKAEAALTKQIIFLLEKLKNYPKRVINVILLYYSNETNKKMDKGEYELPKFVTRTDKSKVESFEKIVSIKYDENNKYDSSGFVDMLSLSK